MTTNCKVTGLIPSPIDSQPYQVQKCAWAELHQGEGASNVKPMPTQYEEHDGPLWKPLPKERMRFTG